MTEINLVLFSTAVLRFQVPETIVSGLRYPFQSQKSRGCGSFSRLEMSAGSTNQKSIGTTTAPPPIYNYYRPTLDRG